MGNAKPYFAGTPCDLDVRRLEAAFGVSEIGVVIEHEAIAGVLGVARTSSRYRSVVSAWRRKLEREHNVRPGAARGTGYQALDARQRVEESVADALIGTRKTVRAAARCSRVVTDDPRLQAQQVQLQRLGAAVHAVTTKAMHGIAPPEKPQQMPRRVRPPAGSEERA